MVRQGKKGVVELQFNWMFVIIAGGVLLLFFFNLSRGQSDLLQKALHGKVMKDLDAIFISAEGAKGTTSLIKIPKSDITFECDRYLLGEFPNSLNNRILFAPSHLKGKELLTWSYDWNVPYRVTNFLYITNPSVQYVYVRDSSNQRSQEFFDAFLSLVPEQLTNITLAYPPILKDEGYDQVRLVFYEFDTTLSNNAVDVERVDLDALRGYDDADVSAIKIRGVQAADLDKEYFYGIVEFYEKAKVGRRVKFVKTGDAPLFGKASLFGALFASQQKVKGGNEMVYSCIMNRAVEKLSVVTTLYKNRAELLKNSFSATSYHPCLAYYDIGTIAIFNSLLGQIPLGYTLASIREIAIQAEALDNENSQAEQQSCPHLF